MTIDEQDRETLIGYRLSQAGQTIDEVRKLIDNEMYTVAVNRIYYGVFYSLLALGLRNGFETSKHQQLLGWFNQKYISSGLLAKEHGTFVRRTYQNRIKGDYDAFVSFGKDEMEELPEGMESFINDIQKLCNPS